MSRTFLTPCIHKAASPAISYYGGCEKYDINCNTVNQEHLHSWQLRKKDMTSADRRERDTNVDS